MMSLKALSEKLKEYFVQRDEIRLVYIFGSVAKGCANKLSDIDVAVFISESSTKDYPYGYRAQIIADLMKILKTNNVDLVVLNRASSFLRFQVLRYVDTLHDQSREILSSSQKLMFLLPEGSARALRYCGLR